MEVFKRLERVVQRDLLRRTGQPHPAPHPFLGKDNVFARQNMKQLAQIVHWCIYLFGKNGRAQPSVFRKLGQFG